MTDLSNSWPFGLDTPGRWRPIAAAVVLLVLAVMVDRSVSLWAQGWPQPVRGALAEITPYGKSDWILYPSGALLLLSLAAGYVLRRPILRLVLWEFSVFFGFIFAGVGLPSLISTLTKRVIGRARPVHMDDAGIFGFHPNWLDWTYQSFPSGHATTAFALATVIGFISPRWFYPGLGLAGVIAVSRVALGAHYPSDVIAGAILGVLGAYAVRWMFARRRWLFTGTPAGGIVIRPMSALRRYLSLRRRGNAPARHPDRP